MYRLKSRQKGIPQAIRFHQPELNWTSRPASFENIVQQIIRVRLGNPHHLAKHGWATDHDSVANELDAYLAKVCLENGWTHFVEGGVGDPPPPPPQARRSLRQSAGNVAAGGRILVEWISSGAEAVSGDQSNRRAGVCVRCPMNSPGDMTSFFTVPVANAIRAALNQREGWNLKTGYDDKLGVCDACGCVTKLKVHMPIELIAKKLQPEVRGALHSSCWIKSEWPITAS
jgi:hypothetical protein